MIRTTELHSDSPIFQHGRRKLYSFDLVYQGRVIVAVGYVCWLGETPRYSHHLTGACTILPSQIGALSGAVGPYRKTAWFAFLPVGVLCPGYPTGGAPFLYCLASGVIYGGYKTWNTACSVETVCLSALHIETIRKGASHVETVL